jgi:hypothetical protein
VKLRGSRHLLELKAFVAGLFVLGRGARCCQQLLEQGRNLVFVTGFAKREDQVIEGLLIVGIQFESCSRFLHRQLGMLLLKIDRRQKIVSIPKQIGTYRRFVHDPSTRLRVFVSSVPQVTFADPMSQAPMF